MEYQKDIRRRSVGRRILISWLIIALIFALSGFIAGMAAKHGKDKEIIIYGQYDGKIYRQDMPDEWKGKDLKFIPLNCPLDEELQEYIFYLASAYEIDFSFVMAVINCESGFKADTVSAGGDYGLMQLNRCCHGWLSSELGITDYLDPYQNIKAGMFVLRKLFEKYENPEKVLLAYNMGEGGAARLWKHGITGSNYTQKVLAVQAQYDAELKRKE